MIESVGRTPLLELKRIDAKGARIFVKVEVAQPLRKRQGSGGRGARRRRRTPWHLEAGCHPGGADERKYRHRARLRFRGEGLSARPHHAQHISKERVSFLRMLGARIVFTTGSLMREAVRKAEEIVAETPGAVMLQQFKNPANAEINRRTTAEEIWTDMQGEVDFFVAGVGTGGTITGVGEVLKARRPNCKVVAVEPDGAAVLSGRSAGAHHLPGLGAGFIPEILNRAVIDEVIAVTEEQAVRAQLALARQEGIAAGMSSGAALAAALTLAERPGHAGKRFVVILPDGGERYAASPVFNEILRTIEGS